MFCFPINAQAVVFFLWEVFVMLTLYEAYAKISYIVIFWVTNMNFPSILLLYEHLICMHSI